MSDAEGSKRGPGPFAILWFVALVAVVGGVIWAQSRSTETTNAPEAVAASPDSAPTSALANGPTLAACQAAARWAALANPGVNDPAEREAWAELQAQMVGVSDPVALAAVDEMRAAYARGSGAVASSGAAEMTESYAAMERNRQAINDWIAGDYSGPPPSQEEVPLPDGAGVLDAKIQATEEIQQALGRFIAACQ